MTTREEWLASAANLIYTQLIAPLATMKAGERYQVSCGFPSTGALSNSRRRVGECWAAESCADGKTRHIFISPLMDELVDGYSDGVLPTLVHELVHTVAAPGHRGEFRRIAMAVGLEGKMTASVAGQELREKLVRLVQPLGPYPHAAIRPRGAARTQRCRFIKVQAVNCTACDYICRTTRVWLADFGPPKCPHGSPMVEVT